MAIFSLVVSACMSTRTKATSAGNFGQFAVRFPERIVDGGQKDATLQIQYGILRAILRRADIKPAAGVALGKIRRAAAAAARAA